MRLVHKRVHELATEERMWAGLWLQKKSLIRDSCGGAYITEPCIQETTLAGMKNCDPARVPTCSFVNSVSLRFEANVIFRHSLWVFESPLSAFQ